MTVALRLLLVEDSEDDGVVLRALRAGGCEPKHKRVYTHQAMEEALRNEEWDAVICDYSMPDFSAPEALEVLKKTGIDLPFIIASGTIGEDVAVAAMKAGAHDFLMKDHLARLVPSVLREVGDARARRESRAALQAAEEARRDRERADVANEAKSQFLASMSHEFRTPLNAIIGFSELLEQEVIGPLNASQRTYIGNVLVSGRHLLALINDILDLSKIEAGHMELFKEATALTELAELVKQNVEPLADKQGVTLTVSIAEDIPPLLVDAMRLKQVLYNLLSNAIKFTAAHGHVTLRAYVKDQHVAISVEDTGIGISEVDQQRLFRNFQQMARSHRDYVQGTGLGLALSKRLVELHGGSIGVESTLGQGTTFTVLLPWT